MSPAPKKKSGEDNPTEKPPSALKGWLFWVLLGGMLAFALFIRFYDLKADPPAFFATGSQDLTTDGAYLTLHARQAAEFGEWDLFGYQTWMPFKVSIVSGLSYLLFSIGGVSRLTANATGGILNLGGILLILFAFWSRRSRRFVLLLAFVLFTSFIITTYARVPFSEDGFLFLAGLVFLAYTLWFDRLWGKVVVGILIALAGLFGKSFGFLVGVGPIAAILMEDPKNRAKDLLSIVGAFAAAFLLCWVTLYRGENFLNFLWEHGAGAHGFPHGFSSPLGFIECLISYGRYGVHTYSPIISLVFYLGALSILLGRKGKNRPDRLSLFMWCWGIAWVLALSPFNYLPLRYLFVLIVPMAVLAADFLDRLHGLTFGGFGRFVWWRIILLLFANWLFVYYLSMNFVISNQTPDQYFHAVWLILPVALLLTALLSLTFRQKTIVASSRTASALIVLVLVATAATEGYQHFKWLGNPIRTIEYANQDTADLVDSQAVIAGQYGPAISYEARVRSFPLFLSADSSDFVSELQKYPVTHIAIGQSAWEDLLKRQPIFRQGTVLARYWMRDNIVTLVRIAGLFGNKLSTQVPLTDFERCVMAEEAGNSDSVGFYLSRFLAGHPGSRVGLAVKLYLTLEVSPLASQRETIEELTSLYPTDFVVCEIAAVYYESLYRESHQPDDLARSENLLERACRLSPQNAVGIRQNYQNYQLQEPCI